LELKFGAEGLALMPLVRAVQKLDVLRAAWQAIRTADTADRVRDVLTRQ
jgi:hypothetical protein